jgi:hypothetical protein
MVKCDSNLYQGDIDESEHNLSYNMSGLKNKFARKKTLKAIKCDRIVERGQSTFAFSRKGNLETDGFYVDEDEEKHGVIAMKPMPILDSESDKRKSYFKNKGNISIGMFASSKKNRD